MKLINQIIKEVSSEIEEIVPSNKSLEIKDPIYRVGYRDGLKKAIGILQKYTKDSVRQEVIDEIEQDIQYPFETTGYLNKV